MKNLFDKVQLGSLELKNRIVRSGLWMREADDHGFVTEALLRTYSDLAAGGAALIVTGYAYVSADDQPNVRMMGASSDAFLPGLTRLSEVIHAQGSLAALQLAAGGSQCWHSEPASMNLLGPSAVANRVTGLTPRAMTEADLQRVVRDFVAAAQRGVAAGFDAIQLHAAHGYLLSQFLAPYYNRRVDGYGGPIHHRARLLYEVVTALKVALGTRVPLLVKLNHDDYMDEGEGLTLAEAKEVALHLEELGIDALEVSGYNESSGKGLGPALARIRRPEQQSYFYEPTRAIAELLKVPVLLMGGNRSVAALTDKLNASRITLVTLAKPLLSEPGLVNRWREEPNYQPRCVSCNKCYFGERTTCVFNRPSIAHV